MTKHQSDIVVVGAGIFGVTAALELQRRGRQVALLDPGPLPHPDAASTDISKVVRMDYGTDEFYWNLMAECFPRWDAWNQSGDRPLYHQTGFLMLSHGSWEPGDFEYDNYHMAVKRGLPVKQLDSAGLASHHPAWNAANYPIGYFNPRAGWAESSEVVKRLIQSCQHAGVSLHEGQQFRQLIEADHKVMGVETEDGDQFLSDFTLVAAGAWTPTLLPELEDFMWAVGQPVIHFRPENLEQFQAPDFPIWAADIGNTGWYGFPAKDDGILKVANHGPGIRIDPRDERKVPDTEEARFRAFFADTFPGLADAPKVAERLCLYCDTWDGDFYIDHVANRPGLLISTGGSGHGFKFAPLLGQIAADVLEGKPNQYAHRFAWRERGQIKIEGARASGN